MIISTGSTKAIGSDNRVASPPFRPDSGLAPEPGLIMLIEDDFRLRGSLATFLDSEGYTVESEANALDALRRLERPPKPSLILLDIMLPYMDGLEFRAVQRRTSGIDDIPVIVITAVGIRPEIASELGVEHSFWKPLDPPRLLETIRRFCPPRGC